jgi:hypothetical protein
MITRVKVSVIAGLIVSSVFAAALLLQMRFFPYTDKPVMPSKALLIPLLPGLILAEKLDHPLVFLVLAGNTLFYSLLIFGILTLFRKSS